MRKLKNCLFLMLALGLNVMVISLVWYYRNDIYQQPLSYYCLERKISTIDGGGRYYGEIILVSNPPRTEQNITFAAEYYFWKSFNPMLMRPKDRRRCYYYAKTKYLNENFKEGEQYAPPCWHAEDNIMDWGNHIFDKLGWISLYLKTETSGYYMVHPRVHGFFWGYPRSFEVKFVQSVDFDNFDEFVKQKKRELGIE